MEKIYLNKEDFNLDKSCIFVAPTGTGKTKALVDYILETKEQCIFVVPLNSIGQQVYERSNGFLKLINCNTAIDTILGDIHNNLVQGNSIIISLTTFIKYKSIFYKYNVFIDECHFLIEYNNLMDTENLAQDIRNRKFKKIIGLTATPFGLSKLLNLEEIKPNVKPKSVKNIELNWITNHSLSYLVGNILSLYKEHGKCIVLYNNISVLEQIANELSARQFKVKLYTSKRKDITIINEHFSNDFDILLCTTALTTGVSIQDDYYSIYIHRAIDSINTIPQFFSRNRNNIVNGCILKRFYSKDNFKLNKIEYNEFYNKTDVNLSFTEFIMNNLQKISNNITKDILDYFVNTCNDYNFKYGKKYDFSEKLLSEQQFVQYIENQREYFIQNEFPKFNKGHYFILDRIYEIYDILIYGYGEDNIYNSYIDDYYIYCNYIDIVNRERFYDFIFEKVKNYKKDISMELAKKCNNNSIDIKTFEELFLDKDYDKAVFKKECIERFALTKEIFKNKNTINEWLKNLGYVIRKGKSRYIIRKII